MYSEGSVSQRIFLKNNMIETLLARLGNLLVRLISQT